jgi:hypothetical protein
MKTITDGGVKLKMVKAVDGCRYCHCHHGRDGTCQWKFSDLCHDPDPEDKCYNPENKRIWIPAAWRVATKGTK